MKSLTLIIFLLTVNIVFAQDSTKFKMSDFIGVNTNIASYDDHFIDDLSKCAKWIREYHSWGHYEVADNFYRWDNITKTPYNYTWPDHNKFMDECKRLGVNVLMVTNRVLEKGQQNFVFNNQLSPGIYLISLNTKDNREIKKVIIQ